MVTEAEGGIEKGGNRKKIEKKRSKRKRKRKNKKEKE